MSRYDELSQKEKQLLAAQYPYKKDRDIFTSPSKKGSDSYGALTEDDINSAISENGDSYSCQLRNNGIVYTVSATKLTKDEFTGLVKSLIL